MIAVKAGLFRWLFTIPVLLLVALWPLAANSQAIIYYVSNPGDLCPLPCHTLSEYQSMSTDDTLFTYTGPAHPDLVLSFLPGEHVLDGNLTVGGANTFRMTSTEQTNGSAVIVARGHLLFSSVGSVVFEGLTFTTHDQIRRNDFLIHLSSVSFLSTTLLNCTVTHFAGFFLCIDFNTNSDLTIKNTYITHNSIPPNEPNFGYQPGIFTTYSGYLNLEGNSLINNSVPLSSLLYTYDTYVVLRDNVIADNHGINCYHPLIKTFTSTYFLNGTNSFIQNGHLVWFVTLGTVFFYGDVNFSSNRACGGPLTIEDGTTLNIHGTVSFVNNTSTRYGGGLIVSSSSFVSLHENSSVLFQNNTARTRGGAVYVVGDGSCELDSIISRPCFVHIESNATLLFVNNIGEVAGDDIYGGDIEDCDLSSNAERVHDIPTLSSVSSKPTHLCLCNNEGIICCPTDGSYGLRQNLDGEYIGKCPYIQDLGFVYPGQNVSLSVIAVGQYYGAAPADIRVYPEILDSEAGGRGSLPFSPDVVGLVPILASIRATCTPLTYRPHPLTVNTTTTYALNTRMTDNYVSILPDEVCSAEGVLVLQTKFFDSCPPGFELYEQDDIVECDCKERLRQLSGVTCDINTLTIQHDGNVWVGYDNQSSESTSGLILHTSPCPFDYCIEKRNVSFSLDNLDEQCNFNRTGLLCGQCAEGLSVKFGTYSQCQECKNTNLALLIPLIALAGIGLIALLLLLRITMQYGTLNGIIFYANIIQIVNADVPQDADHNHYIDILGVFISFLNLDLGIDTCFYDGMDAYTRTWLQFVFPFYLWVLAGLMIVVSNRSRKVTKLLGSNPVAVLATLFLLSYLKLFDTIVTTFSSTQLEFPDGDNRVWLRDGNLSFARGKHLALFLFALFVFVIFLIPYILLLLFGQWLPLLPHWKILSWGNSPKLRFFLDSYHAPYKNQHRYWTGLLLLLRIVISIVYSIAKVNNPSYSNQLFVIVLSIQVVVLAVLAWGWTVRGVYKNWVLDTLESSFFINLALVFFVVHHIQLSGGDITTVVYTSVSIALVTFAGIVSYHAYIALSHSKFVCRIVQRCKKKILHTDNDVYASDSVSESTVVIRSPGPRAPDRVSFSDLRESLLDDFP